MLLPIPALSLDTKPRAFQISSTAYASPFRLKNTPAGKLAPGPSSLAKLTDVYMHCDKVDVHILSGGLGKQTSNPLLRSYDVWVEPSGLMLRTRHSISNYTGAMLHEASVHKLRQRGVTTSHCAKRSHTRTRDSKTSPARHMYPLKAGPS
jgi:hypothetical protein